MKHANFSKHFLALIFISVVFTLSKAQNASISGIVSDENGDPFGGVTVFLENTAKGAVSDSDGKYAITSLKAGDYTVIFKFIGYETKSQKVTLAEGANQTLSMQMGEDPLLLDEVVMIGYGTQQRREISSAVSTIRSEEIESKPVYNFASAMQGKAAGMQITTDNGLAGAPTTIRIRGTKSLSGSAEPLIVIDGVPIFNADLSDAANRFGYNQSPLSLINPNDIESITVLKDAAATAIYGARGSNGVIIVTTKSGKAGKTKIDANYNTGVTMPSNRLQMLNGQQFSDMHREAWMNDIEAGLIDSISNPWSLPGDVHPDSIANTNWIDEMLQIGQFHDASLSASGGSEKTNFYLGGSFRDESTFLKGNEFQRATFRANLNHKATDKLSFGANTSISRTFNRYAKTAGAGGLGRAQAEMLPIWPVLDENNDYYEYWVGDENGNPVAESEALQNTNVSYRTLTTLNAEYKIIPSLTFRNEFGLDFINQHEEFYTPTTVRRTLNDLGERMAWAADRKINYFTWNLNTTLNYAKTFADKHKFEMLVGFNPNSTIEKWNYIEGQDFPTDAFTEVAQASDVINAGAGTGQAYSFMSFFSRINYNFSSKIQVQASFRGDGSSRFATNNKWGFFPAASVGWILSEESFLKENTTLTYLKVRLSGGTSGNAEISNFAQQDFYSAGQNYGGLPGFGPSSISDPDLKWETTLKTGLGIDFGVLQDRVSGSLDLFYERTKDMLVTSAPLAPSSGWTSYTTNRGSLQNMGVEVQLTSNNLRPNSKFKWRTDLNFSAYTNKVLNLGGLNEVSGSNFGENRSIVGEPVGVFYMAEFAGIDPGTGEEMIYDLEGNIVPITEANSVSERKALGKPYPDFFGGLKNSFEYKGLGLDIFFVYSFGGRIYDDHGKRQLGNMTFGWNQDIRVLDRWQAAGDVTDIPKLSLRTNKDVNSSRHLYDASYLRLRNVTLYYNLPGVALQKLHLRSFRINLSVQNAFILTPYKGWDPEVNRSRSGAITQGVTYLAPPQARTITAGIAIGL